MHLPVAAPVCSCRCPFKSSCQRRASRTIMRPHPHRSNARTTPLNLVPDSHSTQSTHSTLTCGTSCHLLFSLPATLGAFALGTVLGWASPTEGLIRLELNYYHRVVDTPPHAITTPFGDLNRTVIDKLLMGLSKNSQFFDHPKASEVGWVGSVVTLGAATVMLPLSYFLDRLGRKLVMLILVAPFTLGWIIICVATTIKTAAPAIAVYCVGRYITGFCAGAFCVAAPVFIGEVAVKEIRGTLGIFFQLLLVVGIFYSYVLGKLSVLYLSIACAVVPVVFGVVFFFIPESPYFLLMKNKVEVATKALQWFRGKQNDISGDMIEMKKTIAEAESTQKVPLKEKLAKPAAKKSLILGMGLMLCQQLCGINAVIFHAWTIFDGVNAGVDDPALTPYTSQLLLGAIQIISTGAAAIVVSKLGNKLLLLISMGVMGLCQVGLGIYFIMADIDAESVAKFTWAPVLLLCLFIMAFSFGAGPVPWSMLGELFPSEIKGFAASVCSFVNWFLAFLVSFTFHFLVESMGRGGPFLLFAALCALGFAFVLFFCIETKGKTLAEIQAFLNGSGGLARSPAAPPPPAPAAGAAEA